MADQRQVATSESQVLVALGKAVGPTTPKKATAWFFWLVGMYIMLAARAPVTITDEMNKAYMNIMDEAQDQIALRKPLLAKIHSIDAEIYTHTGGIPFTWRFDAEKHKAVSDLSNQREKTMQEIRAINVEIDAIESNAKSKLGIWSSAGVDEVRNKFWEKIDAGKRFAKRQTLWDAFISILTQRRDEEAFSFVVRWIFTIAFNFTIGFFLTLVNFMFTVIFVIRSFQPSLISGILFYAVALLGAASVVAGYLMLTVGIAGGGVYVAYKTVSANSRLEGRRQNRYRLGNVDHLHDD